MPFSRETVLWFSPSSWDRLRHRCRAAGVTLREIARITGTDFRNQFYKHSPVTSSQLEALGDTVGFNVTTVLGKPAKTEHRTVITSIQPSPELAEFIGIVLGDGYLSRKSIVITLNSKEQRFAEHIINLTISLFGLKATAYSLSENCIQLKIYSKRLTELLVDFGMVRGDKVRNQVAVPSALFPYRKDVVRGLFDTDGSIYLKEGKYLNLSYTSYSKPLLLYFHGFCVENDIRCTLKNRDVLIQSKGSVGRFIELIDPFKARNYSENNN